MVLFCTILIFYAVIDVMLIYTNSLYFIKFSQVLAYPKLVGNMPNISISFLDFGNHLVYWPMKSAGSGLWIILLPSINISVEKFSYVLLIFKLYNSKLIYI